MKFITVEPNRSPIEKLAKRALERCTRIDAAIAYISDDSTLIKGALEKKIPLRIFGRYDYSAPVATRIMRKFISGLHPNLSMRLVADIFHPKVIWWHKFGAYIGSANLTERAWFRNVEAGIFLTEEELFDEERGGIANELEAFFEAVYERSHALTQEIVDEIEGFDRSELLRAEKRAEDAFNRPGRAIPQLPDFHDVKKLKGSDKKRAEFVKEWDETLQIMRAIGARVAMEVNRPVWVPSETPMGVQADQFLHAYYYNRVVGENQSHPFGEYYHRNQNRKEAALEEELAWWKSLPEALSGEDEHMNDWAPFVREHLSAERVLTLTSDEFFETCCRIHALSEHAKRVAWDNHGRSVPLGLVKSERVRLLSDWLLGQKNRRGEGPLELIHYVLYGGSDGQVARRIFEASFDEKRKIPHLSVSTFGEMVGWALPDKFPPRNGRTSKALNALGYDVRIHT